MRRVDEEVPEPHEEGLVQTARDAQLADLFRPDILPSRKTTGLPPYWNTRKAKKATAIISMTAWINRRKTKAIM